MHAQVGDLCFTPDGLAARGVLLRHLVMPGHESEGHQIMKWLAENVSPDLYVHVMEQYHPRAHVGKEKRTTSARKTDRAGDVAKMRYEEINRPVSMSEVDGVKSAAREAGLWRLLDAAEHGGFNI